MKANEQLRQEIFSAIDEQMATNDPPETKETFSRLKREGYTAFEAKQLIGQCVILELYEALKNGTRFNQVRYIRNLQQLPKEPLE